MYVLRQAATGSGVGTMTDADMLMDGETAAEGQMIVRLSETATGKRTYTVGLSLALAATEGQRNRAIANLFATDTRVRWLLAHPPEEPGIGAAARARPDDRRNDTERVLRLSVLVERMKVMTAKLGRVIPDSDAVGWLVVADLLTPDTSRTRIVTDLMMLVRADPPVVEYRKGGGHGRPSFYRLAEKGGA